MCSKLAESNNFIVTNEYEKVFLEIKSSNRTIYIGDFYGDPQAAAISKNESFCVMIGCGLIIYYLQEPFEEYSYNTSTKQWMELFRYNGNEWWIEEVEVTDNSTIMFTVEEADTDNICKYKLNVYSGEFKKCI